METKKTRGDELSKLSVGQVGMIRVTPRMIGTTRSLMIGTKLSFWSCVCAAIILPDSIIKAENMEFLSLTMEVGFACLSENGER